MKKLYFTLTCIFVFLFSFSQSGLRIAQNSNNQSVNNRTELAQASPENELENPINQTENQSPFDAVKGKKEDDSKRDAYSRHYINEDGSYTAIIGAGPMHYFNLNNGKWEDINHNIVATTDPDHKFANITNVFESHFGTHLQNGIISKTEDGKLIEFLNPQMYWEVNGQAVQLQTADNVAVSVNEDKAIYKNIFGEISAEYTILTGKRELNYIIPSLQALGNIPNQADYLVFVEDIELPQNWTATMEERGISIKNQFGENVYLYENPHSTDAENIELREENTIYEIHENGNIITVKTKVKANWILSQERVFPVKVDPTVNIWGTITGTVCDAGYVNVNSRWDISSGIRRVNYSNREVNGYARYDISSIPVGSTISSVISYTRIVSNSTYSGNGHVWASCTIDPDGAAGSAIFNEGETAYWVGSPYTGMAGTTQNQTLNSNGVTALQNSLSQGWFAMLLFPTGPNWSFNYTENIVIYGEQGSSGTSGNHMPYLQITYAAAGGPPSCATLIGPAHGATGIAHQGLLGWNPVGGATSYDVFFGTSSTPPQVSSNQSETTYTVSDCMLPNTTYYWKVVPKNAYGAATGCQTWSFTTDNKLFVYKNDFETASTGYFGTSGASVDGWYTNTHDGFYDDYYNFYSNIWTVGDGTFAISGKSAGISAIYNSGLAGQFFQYWTDLGILYRWIYRPFDFTGLRDIELSFRWRCGGENGLDYGNIASSINGGSTWYQEVQGGLNGDGKYWGSAYTVRTQEGLILQSALNNASNAQLAFKWNDLSGNGYGDDPSFVIDDIVIKACPYEGTIGSDKVASGVFEWTPSGSTQTTLTVNGSHPCAQYQWEKSENLGVTWSAISGATSVQYTTPSNLTSTIYYRCKVYFGTGCPGVYQNQAFKILFNDFQCSPVTNINLTLGNPANGLNHYLNISWNAVPGAEAYDIQYSTDNTNWNNASPASTSGTSASLNMGDNPNTKYWFRVRAKNGTTICDWTNSSPIFTACDYPIAPVVANSGMNGAILTIQPETPVANPSNTEYAIYCRSTDQYVQTDGSLGAVQVWKTKANWGTVNIIGLSLNTEYCFYVIARNGDGHIVGMQEGNLNTIVSNTFDTNSNFSNVAGSGPTNVWWAPGSSSSGTIMTYNSGVSKCGTNGYVGFSGTYNNYHGTFLRSPSVNCTGNETITLTMDFSNAGTNRQYDYVRFYMWADNDYKYGANANGTGSDQLPFGTGRTCETITVVFDISAIADKSSILFYIAPSCGYNDGVSYFYEIKNVSISINNITYDPPTACITTSSAETPVFHNFGGSTQLSFNYSKHNNDKPVFRLSHSGANATKYEIQVNTKSDFTGTSWSQTYTGTYAGNTETNFEFTQATGNLTSGTTYYVRARIDQGSGWGMWTSELYSFTYNTSTTIPEWFKTTTPQFNTDDLVGTINQSDELKPEVSGGGTLTPITNPSFEQTGGWSSSTNSPHITIERDNYSGNWQSEGNYALRMYLYGGDMYTSDYAYIYQQVDLTGVGKIIFDAQSHYGPHIYSDITNGSTLKLIIGSSTSYSEGTELASIVHCGSGTTGCSNPTLNVTVTVPESLRAPNKYVKFVWSNFKSESSGGGLISFSVDNIRAEAPSFFNSIITTTPSYISSIQNAIGYDKLIWNQTLGAKAPGDIKITIQGSTDGLSFSNITGFVDMPAPDGSGQKNIDISTIDHTTYPYLRAIFYLNNQNVRLHDFGFSYKDKTLPVKLLSFTSECDDDKINFAWSTASEINSDCFEIIETKDFVNFNSLAKIYAAGFSSQIINYNYQDKSNYGKTYYQLKQYDVDGKWEILSTIVANCEDNFDNDIYVYPNPNNGNELIVSLNSYIDDALIMIYDAAGRLVRRFEYKEFGKENILKFRPKLEPGIYVLKLQNSKIKYKYLKFIVN